MKYSLIFSVCIALSLCCFADETMFSQDYKTRIEGIPITTTRSMVKLDDGSYRFRISSSNLLVKLEETSYFQILPDGTFQPSENQSERKIFGVASKSTTRFNWENGVAIYDRKDDHSETPITPGMLDRTLYQYLMELDMKAGKAELSYDVVDKGRMRNFTFENLGVENVDIDGTEMSAFKLRRVTETDERETLVWISADLDYQIVKIYHREDDDTEYTMTRKL